MAVRVGLLSIALPLTCLVAGCGDVEENTSESDASMSVNSDPNTSGDAQNNSGVEEPVRLSLDDEAVVWGAPSMTLCREGLPETIAFFVVDGGPECPEQLSPGGAGPDSVISRGRICQELVVQLSGYTVGETVEANGLTSAVVSYRRYTGDAISITTGDTGPQSNHPLGTLRLDRFEQVGDGYEIEFMVEIDGTPKVHGAGALSASLQSCISG